MALQKSILVVFCILFSFLAPPTALAKKSVYGFLEPITLYPSGISVIAKLDTGAETASLSATHIHVYEKAGEKYVKFSVSHPEIEEDLHYDLPLIRHTKIKGRATEDNNTISSHTRPVVGIQIYFDGKPHIIHFNLIDRSHFSTPILLGREALNKLGAIVDSTETNTILKSQSKEQS